MDKDAMLMKCGRCLQQVPLGDMKYAKDGSTLVCMQCRGLTVQEHADAMRYDASPPLSKTGYACTSCGFTFSRANITPKRCPFCAKETIVLADNISSAKLLED